MYDSGSNLLNHHWREKPKKSLSQHDTLVCILIYKCNRLTMDVVARDNVKHSSLSHFPSSTPPTELPVSISRLSVKIRLVFFIEIYKCYKNVKIRILDMSAAACPSNKKKPLLPPVVVAIKYSPVDTPILSP